MFNRCHREFISSSFKHLTATIRKNLSSNKLLHNHSRVFINRVTLPNPKHTSHQPVSWQDKNSRHSSTSPLPATSAQEIQRSPRCSQNNSAGSRTTKTLRTIRTSTIFTKT